MTTAYYAAPQAPEDSKRLFEAACVSMGIAASTAPHGSRTAVDTGIPLPLRAARGYPSALILAREWGLADLEKRLVDAIEASYEPTWDADSGEFTWGLGLNEEHPRGQYNAFLAAAEASGPGMWERLSAAPLDPCPQVVDVDFPAVALRRAEWKSGALHLRLAPLVEDATKWTTFRIVGVEPRLWYLTGIEGATMDVRPDAVVVRVPMVAGDLEFTPGSY